MKLESTELTPDMYGLLVGVALLSLVIRYFYCNTVRKTLHLIKEENRHMQPREAWLAMIPFFTIYWNFKISEAMANSLTNEFYDRRIAEEENPGKALGYSYSILFALSYIPLSPGFILFMGLFSFIFFIRYWLKVSTFKTLLEEHNRVFNYPNLKEENHES